MPSPALNVRHWRVSMFTVRQPQCPHWPAKAVPFCMGKAVLWVKETCPAGAWPRAKYQNPGICCPNYSKLTSWTFMVPFPLVRLSQEFSFKSRQETDILAGCKQAWGCKQGYPHKTHQAPCGSAGQARGKGAKWHEVGASTAFLLSFLCQVTVQNWKGYKNKAWGHLGS